MDTSNNGVHVQSKEGMGAGLFALRDFAKGEIVCLEKPLICYDINAHFDQLAARVNKFLAPHRSISDGGHGWGDNCPGALPWAFQWTLFLVHLSALTEEEREIVEVYPAVQICTHCTQSCMHAYPYTNTCLIR